MVGLDSLLCSVMSISSFTFIVPISAAKADPERPITTIAVTRGRSSRGHGDRNRLWQPRSSPRIAGVWSRPPEAPGSSHEDGDQGERIGSSMDAFNSMVWDIARFRRTGFP